MKKPGRNSFSSTHMKKSSTKSKILEKWLSNNSNIVKILLKRKENTISYCEALNYLSDLLTILTHITV